MPPDPPEAGSDPYRDEWDLLGPALATNGQRRSPEEGFFTGPEIGTPLPGFRLRSAAGPRIDLHADRDGSKAAVVFFRSAVW
ncbi:MAG: hypothetical protein O7C98_07180 [Planctomycetota bacterium]|nr:hypothetical protein [Planctomycetota bacterium]